MQSKYLKFLLIALIVAFVIPQITWAAWWNPFTWNWNMFNIFSKPKTSVIQQKTNNSSAPSAMINQSSLITTSGFPTITGTATDASFLSIDIDGYLPSKGNTVAFYAGKVPVINGSWSFTPSESNAAFGGPQGLEPGTYTVVVGVTESSSLITGTLTVTSQQNNQTAGWQTYINTEYGFSFKYPVSFGSPQESPDFIMFKEGKSQFGISITKYSQENPTTGIANFDTLKQFTVKNNPGGDEITHDIIANGVKGFETITNNTGNNTIIFNAEFPLDSKSFIGFDGDSSIMNQQTFEKILSTFKFTTPTAANPTTGPTAGWQTFSDNYGFQMQYPPDLNVMTAPTSRIVSCDTSAFPNSCPPNITAGYPDKTEKQTINGINYCFYVGDNIGMGSSTIYYSYLTVSNNVCYALEFSYDQVTDCSVGSPSDVQKCQSTENAQQALINQAISTIKFTTPTTQTAGWKSFQLNPTPVNEFTLNYPPDWEPSELGVSSCQDVHAMAGAVMSAPNYNIPGYKNTALRYYIQFCFADKANILWQGFMNIKNNIVVKADVDNQTLQSTNEYKVAQQIISSVSSTSVNNTPPGPSQ